jgi:HK97 gp10 family phage protein
MRGGFKIEGLKELDEALSEFPRATAKAIGRRVLKEAGEPIARTACQLAPKDKWHLHEGIGVGTKLTKRQAALHEKFSRDAVEVHVGAGGHPQAHLREFGGDGNAPQPFMRPAWDSQKDMALTIVVNGLKVEIEKAAARARRKALKAAGG